MSSLNTIVSASVENYAQGIVIKKITNKSQLKDSQLAEVIDLALGNADYHRGIDEDGWSDVTRKSVTEYVNGVLENRSEFILVALDSDKVCGVIIGGWYRRYNTKYVSIYDLFIPKEYRRQGIAKQLLDIVTLEKIDGKPLIVQLIVYNVNDNAIELYEDWGMKSVVSQTRRMERIFE